jgi:hypothetical protein
VAFDLVAIFVGLFPRDAVDQPILLIDDLDRWRISIGTVAAETRLENLANLRP